MNTAKGANCKVIIVANQKGGVAKSASAVNLSAALARIMIASFLKVLITRLYLRVEPFLMEV